MIIALSAPNTKLQDTEIYDAPGPSQEATGTFELAGEISHCAKQSRRLHVLIVVECGVVHEGLVCDMNMVPQRCTFSMT